MRENLINMHNLLKSAAAFAGGVALMGAIALTSPDTVFGQKQETPVPVNVRVVNKPEEPVPVTGTVTVGNLGSSPLPVQVVNQSNEPALVTGTVNVSNAENSPLLVRDVNNPALQPYTVELRPGWQLPFVPTGKRFVIEQISGEIHGSGMTSVSICTKAGGVEKCHKYPLTSAGVRSDNGAIIYVYSHLSRVYADPGFSITKGFGGTYMFDGGTVLSGYLVDLP